MESSCLLRLLLAGTVDQLLLITLTFNFDVVHGVSIIGFSGQHFIPKLVWVSQ